MGCFDFIGNNFAIGAAGGGGGSGATLSEIWTFDSATVDADPGNKKFRLNNATQSSATFVYISKTSKNGADWGNVLLQLESGDRVYLQDSGDASKYHLAVLTGDPTDATTYVKLPILIEDSGSDLVNNAECGLLFLFSGDVIAGAGLPSGYIDGAEANWASVSTVTIETGKVRNDADDNDINITSQLTANITASGANGLDTGSEASNTWYSIWAIWNASGPTVAALLSLSATSPTLPSGYTKKRLLGWVRNGSTGDFIEFRCLGRGKTKQFMYLEWWPVLTDGSAQTWTAVDCSTYVPPGVFSCHVDLEAEGLFDDTAAWGQYDGSTVFPHELPFEGFGSTHTAYATLDSSRRLGYAVSSASAEFDIKVFGWEGNF